LKELTNKFLESLNVQVKEVYQDFLTRWKDADPDTPILKQAKAESVYRRRLRNLVELYRCACF
jgi:hypothetical protein